MAELKSIILSLCIGGVVLGFALKLFPKIALRENAKRIFGIIFLIMAVSPLLGGISLELPKYDFPYSTYSKEEYEREYKEFIIENTLSLYRADILDFLNEEGIETYGVEIEYNLLDGSAEIEGITVSLKSGYPPAEVKKKLQKKFGVPAKIELKE